MSSLVPVRMDLRRSRDIKADENKKTISHHEYGRDPEVFSPKAQINPLPGEAKEVQEANSDPAISKWTLLHFWVHPFEMACCVSEGSFDENSSTFRGIVQTTLRALRLAADRVVTVV